jgi:hypothetical protein
LMVIFSLSGIVFLLLLTIYMDGVWMFRGVLYAVSLFCQGFCHPYGWCMDVLHVAFKNGMWLKSKRAGNLSRLLFQEPCEGFKPSQGL